MNPRIPVYLTSVATMALLSGCTLTPGFVSRTSGNHAFVAYTPPDPGNKALRLAVKDNIDIKGQVTSAGSEYLARAGKPATADAPCLALARQHHVTIVGRANMSELAVAPSGINEYYGTPVNPLNGWRKLIPGGSSSGSAVAVASGMADVAFGTDTAGSVRVPSACCGVVGLKTTFGLVPLGGVVPIEPNHLDTVGPLARDIATAAQGMELLQSGFAARYAAAKAAKPAGPNIRVGRLFIQGTDPKIDQAIDAALAQAGFQVVPLDEEFTAQWEQAKRYGNVMAAAGAWISDRQYRGRLGISTRTNTAILAGRLAYETRYPEAVAHKGEWQGTLAKTFQKVDFIALPTLQTTPPPIPPNLKIGLVEALVLERQNTVAVNYAGNPALVLPVPLHHAGFPVASLQLIGPRLSEAQLLNAGRLVEAAVKKPRQ